MCVANQSLFEEVFLLDGLRESTSAVSCRCIDPRRSCYRVPNIQVLNWGTTYERAVDVGLCVGSCSKGIKGYPEKKADISGRHHWFRREMTSEKIPC